MRAAAGAALLGPLPYHEVAPRLVQREALELKVWRAGEKDPEKQGIVQLDGYLASLGLSEGTLVIFDRRAKKAKRPRKRRGSAKAASGRAITLLRL